MADPTELTELQLMILGVLWESDGASVNEVHAAVSTRESASRKTIGTLLQRLEQRGFVTHAVEGRANLYRAAVPRRDTIVSRVTSMLRAIVRDTPVPASAAFVDRAEVRDGDVQQLMVLLKRVEEDVRGS
ncbi:MAG: Penicillinase repressor [Gemmatimonadetes bacterium]|nr:Penicillinase repressor [Gemmatimonadota bacterium]